MATCTVAGYEISQVRPEWINNGLRGVLIGFGLGGVCVGIDEMLKGFSLRAFSASTFGLVLGALVAGLIDRSGLFSDADDLQRRVIRLALFSRLYCRFSPKVRIPPRGPRTLKAPTSRVRWRAKCQAPRTIAQSS